MHAGFRAARFVADGRKWLAHAAGHVVQAAFTKRKKAGRREYLRARLDEQGRAEVFASEGSGRISGLSWAEGLVELPDAAADIQPVPLCATFPFPVSGYDTARCCQIRACLWLMPLIVAV
jgi:molybdopterin molybdotransferase